VSGARTRSTAVAMTVGVLVTLVFGALGAFGWLWWVWSETPARSGAKADWAPLCLSVVTAAQPQPPGAQVATAAAKLPSPLSKPSVTGVSNTHGVAVAVGVDVDVCVGVAVGGVPVTVGVGVPRVQPGNLKLPMRVFQLNCEEPAG